MSPASNKKLKIGFVGQGYVGKNYADYFESRGFKTIRYSLEGPYIKNKDLISLCPRQGKNLAKTKRYLIAYLKKSGVKVKEEDFAITVPLITKTSLTVDNKAIHCLGCSFIGGNIINKDTILSSTIPSRYNLDLPNINFNPYSAGICRNNFYFAPALAVARSDVAKIVKARSVNGKVVVKKYEGRAAHLARKRQFSCFGSSRSIPQRRLSFLSIHH